MALGEVRSDIEAAAGKLHGTLGARKEIEKLAEHLQDGETVHLLAIGNYGRGWGLVAATDRRMVFLKDKRAQKMCEDLSYPTIRSIRWTNRISSGTITIFVMGPEREIKTEIRQVKKGDGRALVDFVSGRLTNPAR